MAEPDLKSLLKGKVAILGFGNRLWGNDGAGSVLAERLKAANPQAAVFDGGMVPENYLEKVVAAKPDTVLLIDAADFGGEVGEWRVFSGDELAFSGVSTHAGSVRMLVGYLELSTRAEVHLLAIQPRRSDPGGELTREVNAMIDTIGKDLLKKIIWK